MKEDLQSLLADFEQPPAQFRPIMFWLWIGPLTEQQIDEQIAEFKAKGLGGFLLMPISGRFRYGICGKVEPEYLSEEYLALVRYMAQAAQREGLYMWIFDEASWPSGYANGEVMEGHPEFYAQVLRVETVPVAEVSCWPENCVAAVAVREDFSLEQLPRTCAPAPPEDATHVCFMVVHQVLPENPGMASRPDTLNPAAIRRFIDLTHERYLATCGEFFGNTLAGFFTDEVGVMGDTGTDEIPFTDGMLELFEQRRGFDISLYLPLLFDSEAVGLDLVGHWGEQPVAALRCEYSDLVADLFQEAYWEQITEWCGAHGVVHTGHVGDETTLPEHRYFKDLFRSTGSLSAPAVDTIWRQLWPGRDNFPFPLYVSSAAQLKPAPQTLRGGVWENAVVTESYAVYGYGLNFWQMRWVADYQYLLGINLLMPMHVQSHTSQGRFALTFQHTGRGNPFWRYYEGFGDYIGRLSAVLRRSFGSAAIALYYPIEAVWADRAGPGEQATWEGLQTICRLLGEQQVAFDFLDAASLREAPINQGALETPGQLYTTIVIPATPYLSASVAEKLLAFHKGGGRVCFCGPAPQLCSEWGQQERFAAAMQELLAEAWHMTAASEELASGQNPGGLQDGTPIWDGLTSFFLGAREGQFLPEEIKPEAVLVSSPNQWFKLAGILATTAGHWGLQPTKLTPELMLTTRPIGDLTAHFLLNLVGEPLELELGLIGDQPLLVERWDAATGEVEPWALHEEISEMSTVALTLAPFGSALLVTRPLPEELPALPAEEPAAEVPIIAAWEAADWAEVIEACVIHEGDLVDRDDLHIRFDSPVPLVAWEELELGHLSGAMTYHFKMTLAEQYIETEARLVLGLPEVCYAAEVQVNGQFAGRILWEPHTLDISDLVIAGDNEIAVTVSNSLANQILDEQVIAQSQARGWLQESHGHYFDTARPFMEEALRSGLIGEVVVYLE